MLDRISLKTLLWSLAGAAAAFLALHQFWNADGFWLNLSTEFIGIVVTVWIVDRIVKRQADAEWLQADQRIQKRLDMLVCNILIEITSWVRIRKEKHSPRDENSPLEPWLASDDIMAGMAGLEVEFIAAGLECLGHSRISDFRHRLTSEMNEVQQFTDRHRDRLKATELSSLLALEDSLQAALVTLAVMQNYCSDEGLPVSEREQLGLSRCAEGASLQLRDALRACGSIRDFLAAKVRR